MIVRLSNQKFPVWIALNQAYSLLLGCDRPFARRRMGTKNNVKNAKDAVTARASSTILEDRNLARTIAALKGSVEANLIGSNLFSLLVKIGYKFGDEERNNITDIDNPQLLLSFDNFDELRV